MPSSHEITYNVLILFCALTGVLCTILSFVVAKVCDSVEMRKKYVKLPLNGKGFMLTSRAEACMDQRKMAETGIIKVLRRMEKRMALGNLVMRRLIEANDSIPNDEIKRFEEDLGIDLKNRDFGIPE